MARIEKQLSQKLLTLLVNLARFRLVFKLLSTKGDLLKTNDFIVQPAHFRDMNALPQWAYCPKLKLLLTVTDSFEQELLESFYDLFPDLPPAMVAEKLSSVCHVYAVSNNTNERLEQALKRYFFQQCKIHCSQDFPPPISATITHGEVTKALGRSERDALMRADHEPQYACAASTSIIAIEGTRDYRIVVDSLNGALELHYRTKHMKAEYVAKREEIIAAAQRAIEAERVVYAGIGMQPPTPPKKKPEKRPREEHAFAIWTDEVKRAYIEHRVLELATNPDLRTDEWRSHREKMIRNKAGRIDRGMVDAYGEAQVPHTDAELDNGANYAVAKTEASELMFDFAWVTVCRLEAVGVTKL